MDDPGEPADVGPAAATRGPPPADVPDAAPSADDGAPAADPLPPVAPEPLAEPPRPLAPIKQAPPLWYPSMPAERNLAAAIQATVNEPAWSVDDGAALTSLLACTAAAEPVFVRASPSEPRQRCTLSLVLPQVEPTPS